MTRESRVPWSGFCDNCNQNQRIPENFDVYRNTFVFFACADSLLAFEYFYALFNVLERAGLRLYFVRAIAVQTVQFVLFLYHIAQFLCSLLYHLCGGLEVEFQGLGRHQQWFFAFLHALGHGFGLSWWCLYLFTVHTCCILDHTSVYLAKVVETLAQPILGCRTRIVQKTCNQHNVLGSRIHINPS